MLRPAIAPGAGRHARHRGDHRAGGRLAVRLLARSRGCCSASILASTDGAAIFAVLRGSTLRRRLARTLEGEAGFNDPVAVLLVLGFIDWIQRARLRRSPTWRCCSSRQLGIGLAVGLAVGCAGGAGRPARVRLATAGPLPGGLARGRPRSPSAAPTCCTARASWPSTSPGWRSAARRSRRSARRHRVPRGPGVGRADRACSSTLGLLVFPRQLGDVALEGTVLALVLAVVARPVAALVVHARSAGFSAARARRARLGGPARRGAGRARHLPGDRRRRARRASSSTSSSSRCWSRRSCRASTFEPLARGCGVTTNEPALPAPLVETGTIRRLGAEVVEFPVGADDAVVGRARARARPAARRAAQRDRARRARRSRRAARRASRPATSCTCSSASEVAREFPALHRALAHGPGRAAGAPAAPVLRGTPVDLHDPPVDARRTATPRARARSGGSRSSSSCAPAATSRARSSRSPTAATRSRARSWRSGPPAQLQALRRAAGLRRRARDAEQAWWQEVIGAVALG